MGSDLVAIGQQYLASPREYELRFAVVMLMNYYNDDTYIDNTLKELNNVRHEGYYVKMAICAANTASSAVRTPEVLGRSWICG